MCFTWYIAPLEREVGWRDAEDKKGDGANGGVPADEIPGLSATGANPYPAVSGRDSTAIVPAIRKAADTSRGAQLAKSMSQDACALPTTDPTLPVHTPTG